MGLPSNWRLRGACFGQFVAIGILSTFEAVFMKEQGLGEALIGIINGLGVAIIAASSLFWGRVADRGISEEILITIGFVFGAIVLAILPLCHSSLDFLLYTTFRGLTIPMAFSLMPALVISRLGPAGQGIEYARYRQWGSAGFVLGTLVLPTVVDDIQGIFWLASAFLVGAAIIVARDRPSVSVATPIRSRVPISWSRSLVTFLAANFFAGFAIPGVFGFLSLFARSMDADNIMIGILAGANGIIAVLALPLMGRIVDQFGVRRVLWLAFAAYPIRLMIISFAPNYWWLFAAQPLHLLSFAGYDVASVLYVARHVSVDNRATAQALLSSTRMAGFFFGAILTGYLAEHIGYVSMYQVIAGITSISLIAYMIGLRGQPPLKPVYGQPVDAS
jgi:PPP family 3-phenylpropionic acid transporter